MRTRCIAVAAAIVLFGLGSAHADPKADIEKKIKEAMESYDLMDYDAARKSLNTAVATAKKAHLDKDPLIARAYLDLGIVMFAVPDKDGAKMSFELATQIDPKIQIDAAYRSPDLTALLDEARKEAGGSGDTGATSGPADADCASVKGLQHTIIDSAKGGAPLPVDAMLEPGIKATKVVIMYRPEGATDFTEVRMTNQGCKYTGQIPAAALKGSLVHYYVAAFDGGNKPVAAKGSAGSPNIIEITAGTGGGSSGGDNEDPIGGEKVTKPAGGGGGGGEITSGVTVGPKKPKVMLAVSGGTGSGYVTGTTEAMYTVKNCCIGNPIAVIIPELAYYVNAQTSIGVAIRIGIPLGANVDGHATLAPGGMLRVRYALAESGDGLHVMGQVGAGIIRNTIKIENPMDAAQDTDIVAQGPLLLGGGLGYAKHLSGSVQFLADFSMIAAIAVVDHLGSAPKLNTGIAGDLSIGLALGF